MVGEMRRFYDLTAERVANEWYPNSILMPSITEFVGLLPSHPRVLDLGCGTGHESMRLTSAGAEVTGIDCSGESIRIARQRCPGCAFHETDFFYLDGRFGRFDGIFAAASLIHVSPEEMPDALNRVANVLNPGGHLLAIVRHGLGVREQWVEVKGELPRRIIFQYTDEALGRIASRFELLQDGYLAPELHEDGWRSHIMRKTEQGFL